MTCSGMFLGSTGLTLAIFIISNKLLMCWLKLRLWSKTMPGFVDDCFVFVVIGPRLGVTVLEKWFGLINSTSVLSVFSCRKLEDILSIMAARQQCKESRLSWFSGLNKTYSGESALINILFITLSKAVLAQRFFIKPDWCLFNILFPTISTFYELATTFSTIFESKGSLNMGQ